MNHKRLTCIFFIRGVNTTNKQKIRRDMLVKRRQLAPSIITHHIQLIAHNVCQSPLFLNASTIFIYLDYLNEVQTGLIIAESFRLKKTVAIPKIIDNSMKFFKITSLEDVARGTFNILEPTTNESITAKKGLMIMPGVAFDKQCHCIGHKKRIL